MIDQPQVVFSEVAHYRCPEGEATLRGRVAEDGVRIGVQFLEPMYGGGVLIPPGHPAYPAAVAFLAALTQAQVEARSD